MSTIDAAIIKAMTENLSECMKKTYQIVPQVTMSADGDNYFKLTSTQGSIAGQLTYGYIIRLKTTSGETIDFTCVLIQDISETMRYYGFAAEDGQCPLIQIDPSNSSLKEATFKNPYTDVDFLAPDNVSTGYMQPLFGIGAALGDLSAKLNTVLTKVKTLEKRLSS